jgi:hypothetical protein
MLDETPDSPDWWLLRLGRRMRKRQGQLDLWWTYYKGCPPLPHLPANVQEAFVQFQRKARTNLCGLVATASVHRIVALGITGPGGEPDAFAQRWWQHNKLDSRQRLVWRSAMARGTGYLLVGEHPTRREPDGAPSPLVTVEHPAECIVEYDPVTGDGKAGLKAWHDDVSGFGVARLYFDNTSFPYRTRERCAGGRLPWGPDSWVYAGARDDGDLHDLGMLPLLEFARMPDLGEDPEPEFACVMDIQDRINLGVLNRMSASRYSGFRQKWIKGHKFAKRTDPATGLTVVDQPFVPSPSAVWASEGENAQFGQLDATDLTSFLKEHTSDVRDALIISQTPAYYYASDLVNISADTINALDILHIAKVREHQASFGEALEDAATLAARIVGRDTDYAEATVRWQDPRQLNPAVMADAGTKLKAIGYPLDVIAEILGEGPERIQRITAGAAAQALLAAALLPAPGAPTAGNLPDDGGGGG